MTAAVGLLIVITTSLPTFSRCEAQLHPSQQTAVARKHYTSPAKPQTAVTPQATAEDDEWLKKLSKMVKDGLDTGKTLLSLAQWPLNVGLSLHSAAITQIGAFITWFNFLASFVIPGGTGSSFLSWLRGNSAKDV